METFGQFCLINQVHTHKQTKNHLDEFYCIDVAFELQGGGNSVHKVATTDLKLPDISCQKAVSNN